MNKKKGNSNKIRLSLPNTKHANLNEHIKLSTRKSFDDNKKNTQLINNTDFANDKNEFWTDCLEYEFNNNINKDQKNGRNHQSVGLKKKSNSVFVENNELQLIKEIEENKEDTGRNTKQNQFEGYLTFKKEIKVLENSNDISTNYMQKNKYISTCEIPIYNIGEVRGKSLKNEKEKQQKFHVGLEGRKDDDIIISKGNSNESNGNNSNSCNNKASTKQRDRCLDLYEKGKMKNDLNKIIYQKNIEAKEEKLVSECTFKPWTNSVMNPTKEKLSGKLLYERTVKWKKDQMEKIDKKKKDEQNSESVYSFKPEIHKPNIQILFDSTKNLDKNEKVTHKFISRQENARIEELKKKARFDNLGKVKNNQKYNNIDIINTQTNEAVIHNNNHLEDIVKNLRKELQEINLDRMIEIDI